MKGPSPDRARLGRSNVRKPSADECASNRQNNFSRVGFSNHIGTLPVAEPETGAVRCLTALIFCILAIFWPATSLWAQQQAAIEEGRTRFCAVDIYLDSGSTPLAAYQLEFTATNGAVRIVGIEGGEHPAFRNPPFYDPKAIQQERVILAAFSTAAPKDLPAGKTRVATIHIVVTGGQEPGFTLKVDAAADANGVKVSPQASYEESKTDAAK